MNNKIAIVTALCGNRESLTDPTIVYENADYHAFVENEKSGLIWNQHLAIPFSGDKRYEARRNAKIYKILPELFLPGYDYYIWVDNYVGVIKNPEVLCETYASASDFCVFKHRKTTCVYQEARVLLELGFDHADLIYESVKYFNEQKYPSDNGLYELPAFIKKNTKKATQTSLRWWEFICKYSSRDQISFPVCAWQTGAKINTFDGYINGHCKNGLIEEIKLHVPSTTGN